MIFRVPETLTGVTIGSKKVLWGLAATDPNTGTEGGGYHHHPSGPAGGCPRSLAREDRQRAIAGRHTGAEPDSALFGRRNNPCQSRTWPRERTQSGGCCTEASPPAAHTVHHSLCQCGPVLTPRRDLRALFTVDRGSEPLAYRPLPAVGMRICVVLALVLATATVANGNLAVPFPFGSPQAPQPVNVPPFASSIRLLSRLHSVVHDTSQSTSTRGGHIECFRYRMCSL